MISLETFSTVSQISKNTVERIGLKLNAANYFNDQRRSSGRFSTVMLCGDEHTVQLVVFPKNIITSLLRQKLV